MQAESLHRTFQLLLRQNALRRRRTVLGRARLGFTVAAGHHCSCFVQSCIFSWWSPMRWPELNWCDLTAIQGSSRWVLNAAPQSWEVPRDVLVSTRDGLEAHFYCLILVLVLRKMFSTSVLQLPVTCSLLNVTLWPTEW